MSDLFVLDKNSHIPIFSEICTFCRHLDASGERKCTAFPHEIPLAIWMGENNHRTPYPGDHGVLFLPVHSAVPELPKKAKPRKRRLIVTVRSAQVSRVRSRLWQDPQTREKIAAILEAAIANNQLGISSMSHRPSAESLWLDNGASVKGKPHKKKAIVGR